MTFSETRPRDIFPKGLLAQAVRCLLGIVLVISAALHLNNPYRFLDSLLNYRIVWGALAEFLALALPNLQLIVGSALITGVFRKGAILLAAALFLAFEAAQASALIRGLEISCGCFGDNSGLVSGRSLTLTTVLLAACLWAVFAEFQAAFRMNCDRKTGLPSINSDVKIDVNAGVNK
jgi:putative oxidoreductase